MSQKAQTFFERKSCWMFLFGIFGSIYSTIKCRYFIRNHTKGRWFWFQRPLSGLGLTHVFGGFRSVRTIRTVFSTSSCWPLKWNFWKGGKLAPQKISHQMSNEQSSSMWWQLKYGIFDFHPEPLGRWSNLTSAYFSDWLVQPQTGRGSWNPIWNPRVASHRGAVVSRT